MQIAVNFKFCKNLGAIPQKNASEINAGLKKSDCCCLFLI